jgi:hypothetical protein
MSHYFAVLVALASLLAVVRAAAANEALRALVVCGSTRAGRCVKHWTLDAAHAIHALAIQHTDRRITGAHDLAVFAVRTSEHPTGFAAIEERFARAFPGAGQARAAAAAFTAAVTLASAGAVGALTAGNDPVVHPPHHRVSERASGPSLEGAAVPATPAPDTTTSTEPQADAAASPAALAATAPPDTTPAPVSPIAAQRGGLPIGKGMWIWLHDRAEGGDVNMIVERSKLWGLTHLYVRTGTLREGFMAGPFLDRLLPVAHANGIRVYGWDFPYMNDPVSDINRAAAAIRYTTPDGHRIDGFAPDIETKHEGTNESIENIRAYVHGLRANVGGDYPLIAVIPNPTAYRISQGYPFGEIVAPFDAIAPMVYWMNREPGADVAHAMSYLSQFGKPIFPIGQAYDGAIDGGPPGVPNRDAIIRFMQVADQLGGMGVSFWSWQHASLEAWQAINEAMEFRLGEGPAEALRPSMIRAYQLQLAYLGYAVTVDGQWGPATAAAVSGFQRDHRLPETGGVDGATRQALLKPRPAAVRV